MEELIRTSLHEALDGEPTPLYLRSQVMRSLPVAGRANRWQTPKVDWARSWVAALLTIAVVAGLIAVGRALGPQLVRKTPERPIVPALVSSPTGLVIGPDGSLYFADYISGYVFRREPNGTLVTVAGTRPDVPINQGDAGNHGPATQANLFGPLELVFDRAGNLYIADTSANRIRKVDRKGVITTVAGTGPADTMAGEYAGDGGPAVAARLSGPHGVAVAANGDIYIADTYNNAIRRVDAAGRISSLILAGLPIPRAEFHPDQLVIDGAGNLYVLSSDFGVLKPAAGCAVLRRAPSGDWSMVAGTGVCGLSGDGGKATDAEIYGQGGLTLDASGNVYFSDPVNGLIRRVDRAGSINTVWTGLGVPGGLAVTADGVLYVAEAATGMVTCSNPIGACVGSPQGQVVAIKLSSGSLTVVVDGKTPIRTLG